MYPRPTRASWPWNECYGRARRAESHHAPSAVTSMLLTESTYMKKGARREERRSWSVHKCAHSRRARQSISSSVGPGDTYRRHSSPPERKSGLRPRFLTILAYTHLSVRSLVILQILCDMGDQNKERTDKIRVGGLASETLTQRDVQLKERLGGARPQSKLNSPVIDILRELHLITDPPNLVFHKERLTSCFPTFLRPQKNLARRRVKKECDALALTVGEKT